VSNADFDQAHVEASAAAVATLLTEAGMPEVQVLRADRPDGTPGAPAVVARRPAPAGAPTVLLYAHHDVQPPGSADDWDTDPFVPTEKDGRLFGRGAADDKAGVVAHLGALRVLGDELGVGVTVFVEGEEEIGSPSFTRFLHTYADLLRADVIVVADSSNWKVGVPGLTTSLRGLVDLEVEVAVLDHAVHSGMFGGPVLDAVTLLSRLIATLHDDEGSVAVAGLTTAPDPAVDYDEDALRADAGVLDGVRLAGTGPLTARLWTRPTIAVIGLDAPRVATASNTITPKATAKLSMRVAPGEDPARALEALRTHLVGHAPFGARVTVKDGELGKPFQAPADSTAMQAARAAFADAWGTDPVDIGIGGSIPFIADLLEVFPQAAILVTGVEDPDSRAHGANESVHLAELEKVVLAEALLLARLA
jgi:acetylornithine deacetylase/succinyl-diaminopimelate desuccinylase-like protein